MPPVLQLVSKCPIEAIDAKIHQTFKQKKDRLIKESVLKRVDKIDGYNCTIVQLYLEIYEFIDEYNRKIESVSEGQTIGYFAHFLFYGLSLHLMYQNEKTPVYLFCI